MNVSVTSATTADKPPVLYRPRFTCDESGGAGVVVKLRNRTRIEAIFEVRVSRGEYQEALPVYLPPRGVGSVEFAATTEDGRYVVEILNVDGDYVAQTSVMRRCLR